MMARERNKLQSAMEYLMTYGWAILIIAVVLGALFQLGIFNASTFTPKAPPGSCQVFRPNGPYTTSFLNLEGICNGELPQYVMEATSTSAAITVTPIAALEPSKFTISLWFYQTSMVSGGGYPGAIGVYSSYVQGYQVLLGYAPDPATPGITVGNAGIEHYENIGTGTYKAGSWSHFVATFDGNLVSAYFNGKYISSTTAGGITYSGVGSFYVFRNAGNVRTYMSNLQFYNASLSANEISALYNEGIGGAPVQLNNLVGWWPLNGDAKDYSGNNNNGVPTSISFTNNWASDYTPP